MPRIFAPGQRQCNRWEILAWRKGFAYNVAVHQLGWNSFDPSIAWGKPR